MGLHLEQRKRKSEFRLRRVLGRSYFAPLHLDKSLKAGGRMELCHLIQVNLRHILLVKSSRPVEIVWNALY